MADHEQVLSPVASRSTIQDGVYQQLRQALMTGRFDPEQVLTIASLAESFGTSHMPVREALRRLAAENAIEIAANGSACVPAVSRERLDDLTRARVVLESLAGELATPNLTRADIKSLDTIVAAHEASARQGQVYAMLLRNQEFHFTIYRAAGSAVLLQLIETLWLRHGPYMRMLSHQVEPRAGRGGETFTGHHRAIIEALRASDAAGVRDGLAADIRATQSLLQSLCPAGTGHVLYSPRIPMAP